jgi:hypothetical protein
VTTRSLIFGYINSFDNEHADYIKQVYGVIFGNKLLKKSKFSPSFRHYHSIKLGF